MLLGRLGHHRIDEESEEECGEVIDLETAITTC